MLGLRDSPGATVGCTGSFDHAQLVTPRNSTAGLRLVSVLAVIALGLAACAGGGDDGEEIAADQTTVTSSEETATTEATVPRRRLPGPPGPVGPPAISDAIAVWHPLVEAGVPGGSCRPLLESVQGRLGRDAARETGGRAYVLLYRGIAHGCLGQLQEARSDLTQARRVGLGPDETSTDRTCNAQLLLAFGFATYLNEEISPVCPPATTTTTRRPTTTTRPSATTTTRLSTTTTRASTTTTR